MRLETELDAARAEMHKHQSLAQIDLDECRSELEETKRSLNEYKGSSAKLTKERRGLEADLNTMVAAREAEAEQHAGELKKLRLEAERCGGAVKEAGEWRVRCEQTEQELHKMKQASSTQPNNNTGSSVSFKQMLASLPWTTAADAVMLAEAQHPQHGAVLAAGQAVQQRASLALSYTREMVNKEPDLQALRQLRIGAVRDLVDAFNCESLGLKAELSQGEGEESQGKQALVRWYDGCNTQLQAHLKERVETAQTVADALLCTAWEHGSMADTLDVMAADLAHRQQHASHRLVRSRSGVEEAKMRIAWMEDDVLRWRHNLVGATEQGQELLPIKKQVLQLRRLVRTLETENGRLWREIKKLTNNSAAQHTAPPEELAQLSSLNQQLASELQVCRVLLCHDSAVRRAGGAERRGGGRGAEHTAQALRGSTQTRAHSQEGRRAAHGVCCCSRAEPCAGADAQRGRGGLGAAQGRQRGLRRAVAAGAVLCCSCAEPGARHWSKPLGRTASCSRPSRP